MPRGLVATARSGGHCPLRVSGGILSSERGQSRDAINAVILWRSKNYCPVAEKLTKAQEIQFKQDKLVKNLPSCQEGPNKMSYRGTFTQYGISQLRSHQCSRALVDCRDVISIDVTSSKYVGNFDHRCNLTWSFEQVFLRFTDSSKLSQFVIERYRLAWHAWIGKSKKTLHTNFM